MWFKFAPNPSGGIRIANLPNGKDGWVNPEISDDKILGTSIMFLHGENAFTSLEKLFSTLGHELVHVSQILALTGLSASETIDKENFKNAMEHYAYMYSSFLGGGSAHFNVDWSKISPENRAKINFTNYLWTYLYNKPF